MLGDMLGLEERKALKSKKNSDSSLKYLVSLSWYTQYREHKKDGKEIGKVETLSLVNSNGELRPDLEENKDYKALSEKEWTTLSRKYGSEEEVILIQRNSLRSVSSSGYDDETPRGNSVDQIKLPISARKFFDESFCISMETTSKLASLDSDNKFSLNEVSSKIGLEKFEGSNCLNSSLQLLFTISPLVDYFNQSSSTGEFFNSEFLIHVSILMLSVSYMHSGILQTSTLYKMIKYEENEPGLLLEKLLNKIDLEFGSQNFLQQLVFNGIIKVEHQCLHCRNEYSYDMNFINLSVQCCKSIEKALETFSRCNIVKKYCENCKKDTDTQKRLQIVTIPNYLMIIIKRWEERSSDKKTMRCIYKRKLSLDTEYRLVGVIASTLEGCLSYCKRKKIWYQYQNEKYLKINSSTALSAIASVLLYKK